jgi:FMN-dependent oxidoreductase (nitrilotriacetate monooxygenase family)
MKKPIRLNAFTMNTVGHQSPGLWTHPRDRSSEYRTIGYWTGLARLLERGLFDGVFIADVLGVYDVFGGTADAALRHAIQVPANDPLLLVPAMAAVTEHLGFGVTFSLTYEHPYPFARRMSTLDHLTGGRVGWNIVTGYLDSAARNLGLPKQMAHDERYDLAEEYLEVLYKLWECSWEDDAVLRDKATGQFTDPAKVHPIQHRGRDFTVPGIHLSEPSPQRTPVLYQAGTSARGRIFAGRHAECVFMSAPSIGILKRAVDDVRAAACECGRESAPPLVYAQALVITGATNAEAHAKYEEYRRHIDLEAALALLSGWTGVDFSRFDLGATVEYIDNDAGRSALASFSKADPSRKWTVREAAEFIGLGGRGPVLVGGPEAISDQLEQWMDETEIDGFNLAFAVAPETFEDVVKWVVPELQRRGRYRTSYPRGTLREKLFGGSSRLPSSHPGRSVRIDPLPLEAGRV